MTRIWGSRASRLRLCMSSLIALVALMALQKPAGAGPEEGCLTASINGERQAQGARALSTHSGLVSIARRHSARMAEDQRFYHNSNLRSELPSGWRSEGENVGWATDCARMHDFFMNSASHRKNILNRAFNQVGVGVVVDGEGKLWVTEVFMESSSDGFSTEPRPALSAPPAEPDPEPAIEEPPEVAAPVEPKLRGNESDPKPAPARVPATKAPAPRTTPASQKSAAKPSRSVVQTPALEKSVHHDFGWDEMSTGAAVIVFDLEAPV